VLGACLLTPEAIASALDLVSAEDFYRPAHGHIFDAIATLSGRRDGVDPVTVADSLERAGLLEDVGGLPELISLQADTPATSSAGRYARIVAERAVMRRMIAAGGELEEMGYSLPDDVGKAAERARDLVARIAPPLRPSLSIRSFADIDLESVEWVWPDRIPRGGVTIIAGDPGVGKSFVMLALAAGLSVGAALPGGAAPTTPTQSLIVNYEDAAGVTLKRRIAACGADQRRIHYLDGVMDGVGIRPFRPDDAGQLESELSRRPDVAMVVIDPVGSLLAGKLDMARDNEVRGALMPLVDMARRTNTAVVAVMHLRKADAERAIYRVGGSVGGFVGMARSVLVAGQQQGTGRRAVAHAKCNVGPEVDSVEYVIGPDGTFAWKGIAADLSADRILAGGNGEAGTKRDQAGEWLYDRLKDGPVERNKLQIAGRRKGFSPATLKRAYEDIGADSFQKSEKGKRGKGPSFWLLNDEDPPDTPLSELPIPSP
jgi:hypothetical protein